MQWKKLAMLPSATASEASIPQLFVSINAVEKTSDVAFGNGERSEYLHLFVSINAVEKTSDVAFGNGERSEYLHLFVSINAV
jgi:hypothetical protein